MDRAPRLDDLIALVRATAPDDDPLAQLRTAAQLKADLDELADALLGHFVDRARRAGATWTQIGDALGVSKQAAQQRHASPDAVARRLLAAALEDADGLRRFTPRAKAVVAAAERAAVDAGAAEIGTLHLLAALHAQPEGIAAKVLVELGLDAAATEAAVAEAGAAGPAGTAGPAPAATASGGSPRPSEAARDALAAALVAAVEMGHNYVGTEHLLLGLLSLPAEDPAAAVLARAGITAGAAAERVRAILAPLTGRG